MSDRTWRFRTTQGVVTVREDAIAISSTPGRFLAGQRRRWRHGERWERGWIAFQAIGFLWSLAGLARYGSQALQAGATGVGVASVPHLLAFALFTYAFWSTHVGETTIPLSRVERLTLDEEARTLAVVYRPEGGPLSAFRDDEWETKLSLSTADACREAREIFRLRGIDLDEPEEEGEPQYRVVTRAGVVLCARCRSQVSPSEDTCHACGFAVQVRSKDAAAGDPVTEESISWT